MSLYDGLDVDAKPGLSKSNNSDLSGWGSSLKLLETQKQLQAKKSLLQNMKKKATSASLAPVIDLKGRKNEDAAAAASGSFRFNQLTGRMEHMRASGGVVAMSSPFIGSDAPMGAGSFLGVTDEYDPLRPNDYETFVKIRKAERQKEREAERARLGEDRQSKPDDNRDRDRRKRDDDKSDGDDDDDDDDDRRRSSRSHRDDDRGRRNDDGDSERKRRRRDEDEEDDRSSKRSGAAIAPPPSLLDLDVKPTEGFQSSLETGSSGEEIPNDQSASKFGLAGSVASKIMARMGYKLGQGLGKSEQGMSIALQVEKTSRRGGKIIHERDLLKGAHHAVSAAVEDMGSPAQSKSLDASNATLLRNPSKVIVLRNMVGPGEVDAELEGETAEECSKFGKVIKCLIFEIPGVEPEEAVRIFLEFERMESATKALVDLNGRFFGGRVVKANFYNLDRFRRLDLGGDID